MGDALKWAMRHPDFRYLVDPLLVGWLWPHEYETLIARLQKRHPGRYAELERHILPFEPH